MLLLDEVTSALDEENKRHVNALIHQLVAEHQLTVLWVTHNVEEIRHADEVITLPVHTAQQQRSTPMNQHNITNESLALSIVLVVIAMLISHREKLALEKDIIWSVCRAVVQLIIIGYVLKYIFDLNNALLTVLMVLFICSNAAYNAKKRVVTPM